MADIPRTALERVLARAACSEGAVAFDLAPGDAPAPVDHARLAHGALERVVGLERVRRREVEVG